MTTSAQPQKTRRMRRWVFVVGGWVVVLGVVGGLLGWIAAGSPAALRVVRATLRVLPEDPRASHPLGQWAALAQGRTEDTEAVDFVPLIRGPWTSGLMRSIASDPAATIRSRVVALQVLAITGEGPESAVLPLLYGGPTPPHQRQALALDLIAGPDGARWADLVRDLPLHDLDELGTLGLVAAGEPGLRIAAARALRAAAIHRGPDATIWALHALGLRATDLIPPRGDPGLSPAEALALDHHPCAPAADLLGCTDALATLLRIGGLDEGEADALPQPPLLQADDALAALFADDGEAADLFREEVHHLATWVQLGGETRGPARLRFALVHPQADPPSADAAWEEAGRPHAAFARGGGMPGATAAALEAVGAESGATVRLWTVATGILVEVAGARVRLEGCKAPVPIRDLPEDARFVPPGGGMALGVLEAMGRSLRAGDWASARAQAASAQALWPGAPGVAKALAIAAALRPPPQVFPKTPPRRSTRRMPRRAPLLPPIEESTAIPPLVEAATPAIAPEDRVVAAWWIAQTGEIEKARTILGNGPAGADPLDQRLRPVLDDLLAGRATTAPDALIGERGAECPAFLDWGPGPRPLTP